MMLLLRIPKISRGRRWLLREIFRISRGRLGWSVEKWYPFRGIFIISCRRLFAFFTRICCKELLFFVFEKTWLSFARFFHKLFYLLADLTSFFHSFFGKLIRGVFGFFARFVATTWISFVDSLPIFAMISFPFMEKVIFQFLKDF